VPRPDFGPYPALRVKVFFFADSGSPEEKKPLRISGTSFLADVLSVTEPRKQSTETNQWPLAGIIPPSSTNGILSPNMTSTVPFTLASHQCHYQLTDE